MTRIMIVGIQLYSSLSLLARQSMLMLTELPGMVTVFDQFFHLEYSDSYTCSIHSGHRIDGYHYCSHSQGTAFETLLALNYNSFILTVAILLVLVSTALRLGDIKYLILMLEICIISVIVKGHVLLEIPSMHELVQYFQTLHRNEDIYMYELKGVHIATFEAHLFFKQC